jgi:predicted ATP-grasp superfamily ATP-dependent carboligase
MVGDTQSWSKAGLSRFSSGTFRYASPQNDPQRALADILRQTQPGTLILPMTEATTLLISTQRDEVLATGASLVLPEHRDLLRAVDKKETTRLAESLGIAVPLTFPVNSQQETRQASAALRFPVVLKPRTSEQLSDQGEIRTTGRPRYARDPAELERAYSELTRTTSAGLVQEFVEGAGTGYFALMNHGVLRAEFAHRRLRDVHPTGSGSALRESILPDRKIREASLAMLKELNWHGVAMVEFRLRDDGVPVFLEINGRFWHSLPLACYAGVDFPALLAHMAEHGDVDPPPSYRTGVRCRWLVGDFRHLAEVLKGRPAGYPGKFPRRLNTFVAELTPLRGTFHDNFMWQDPLPEFGDWIRLLHQVLWGGS